MWFLALMISDVMLKAIQRIIQRCFFNFGDLSVLRAIFKFNIIVTNDGGDEQILNIFYINLHVVIH
jgi:hypothetical protein